MERKYLIRALGLAVVACSLLGWAGLASADIVIETVPVGNPGNAPDPATGNLYGAVGYAYNIGKYEVTAGQYTEFLNAVGGVDTYALYNSDMSRTDYGSGIARAGGGTVANPYSYTVDPHFISRPVNYVSFWDACRFANWLQNGRGNGDTETGAYSLTSGGISGNTVARNAGATWAVTSEDEWYKAAYFDPDRNGVGLAGYWLYPTRSDTAPGNNMADPRPGNSNANYCANLDRVPLNGYPLNGTYCTTIAGEFQNSASAYGTFDQGGNVWEWNEATILNSNRVTRGGSFNGTGVGMQSDLRGSLGNPLNEYPIFGFRVSQIPGGYQVPEPASLGILTLGVIGLLARRRAVRR
jgi:formylglycine-generating enzyme